MSKNSGGSIKALFVKVSGGLLLVVGLGGGMKGCTFDDGGIFNRDKDSKWHERFGRGASEAVVGSAKAGWGYVVDTIENTDPDDIADGVKRTKEAAGKVGGAVVDGLKDDPQP